MESAKKAPGNVNDLIEHLYNPVKLRSVVTALILSVGYITVYMPFSSGMDATTRERYKERKRLELAQDVEHLRKQYDSFKQRIPKQRDPNEWVQYVLEGIRQYPLKMSKLDSEDAKDLGPYKLVVLRMELEGGFREMDSLLNWFETNERMFRVDSVKIAPHRSGRGILVMQLVVLGVMG